MLALLASAWLSGVERPPGQYAQGPSTAVVVYVDSAHEACTKIFGQLPVGKVFQACYVPAADVVFMPIRCKLSRSYWCEDLLAHELAHSRGWRH